VDFETHLLGDPFEKIQKFLILIGLILRPHHGQGDLSVRPDNGGEFRDFDSLGREDGLLFDPPIQTNFVEDVGDLL